MVFGPFPAHCAFPIFHTVTYQFELKGTPIGAIYNPGIETFLPDRVVLVTRPTLQDLPKPVHN